MRKGKYRILLPALLLSALSLCGQVQNNQLKVASVDNTNHNKQDSLINSPDSIGVKNLNKIVSDKLDSLVKTWYVKNAFKVDTTKFSTLSDSLISAIPDSVYVNRLKNLDSYINLPFNETVKHIISFYNRRPTQVSIMMGLSNYYFPL